MSIVSLSSAPHALLEVASFVTDFQGPLGGEMTPDVIRESLSLGGAAPFASDDAVRKSVRDLLRLGGYKPTGRGKPASEYLLGAAAEAPLPSINLAVDAGNAASLHSGLPISVINLQRARAPFAIRVAEEGTRYVFNAAGQEIDVAGLLCLFDAEGACANAVKDSQRTKTHVGTTRTLSVVWGTSALPGRAAAVARVYRQWLEASRARCFDVVLER